jgi:Protein of unknown function DUF262
MKAEERTISNILTEQLCYEIPPYQRPYSWEKENVQQLLDDIWEAYASNDNEYFIGSIITIERERDRRYEVVDGQQRLTSLNLVLARLRDRILSASQSQEHNRWNLRKVLSQIHELQLYFRLGRSISRATTFQAQK